MYVRNVFKPRDSFIPNGSYINYVWPAKPSSLPLSYIIIMRNSFVLIYT